MKDEKIYVIALIVVALLASIPQIPVEMKIWGAILVIVGLIGGVMLNYPDMAQRTMIYVLAVALPMFANSLDYIPVAGEHLNTYFDNLAIGVQGLAVGLVVMGLISRARG